MQDAEYAQAVPLPLPRAYRLQLEHDDREKVDRIVRDAETSEGSTAGGDWQRLRGVPAIGRGVAGAIRGTRPGDGLFR